MRCLRRVDSRSRRTEMRAGNPRSILQLSDLLEGKGGDPRLGPMRYQRSNQDAGTMTRYDKPPSRVGRQERQDLNEIVDEFRTAMTYAAKNMHLKYIEVYFIR